MDGERTENKTEKNGANDLPSRYGKKERYAARITLVVIVVILARLLHAMFGGYDVGTVAISALALLIAGPVLAFFMFWSLTRLRVRSCEAGEAALNRQFVMIDTVIFDIGNVLADFSYEAWFAASGYPPEIQQRAIRASVLDPVWNEIDRGVWSYEEFVDGIVKNDPAIEKEIRDMFSRDYDTMITARERSVPWIRELKAAGYRVLYLSNFSERAHRECRTALSFMEYTDGGIMSYQEKVIKPDEAIYRLLIERYGITPARAVFIDDREDNVETAERLGIHGIVCKSVKQAEEDLRALGVSY